MAWALFRRDGGDGFEMIGVDDDLLDAAPISRLPLACEITIEAPSAMPELLASAEAAIDSITDEIGGRVAGTGRTAARLWTLVHLPSDEHAARYTQIPLPTRASVSVAPSNDPDWTLFDRVRPVDMEQQSMRDLALMAQLHAAGDVGGVRRVEHVVTGLNVEQAPSFIAAAERVDFVADPLDGDRAVLYHDADPTDITPESWTLRLIAERHGATYDGWRCQVIRAPERGRPWWRIGSA